MPDAYSRLAVAALVLLTSMALSALSPVSAASSFERIALQLNGPLCSSHQATIQLVLSPLSGVRAVDLSSVPGHALVDIDTDVLSAQDLIVTVRNLWHNENACLVEPMQSCISAGPLSHVVDHAARVH